MIYRIVAIISTPSYENRNSATIDPISQVFDQVSTATIQRRTRQPLRPDIFSTIFTEIGGEGRGEIVRIITRQFLIAFKVFSRIASNLGGLIGKIETKPNGEREREEKKRKKERKEKKKKGRLANCDASCLKTSSIVRRYVYVESRGQTTLRK